MKNYIFLLFFISTNFAFSQGRNLSINQIDSICKIIRPFEEASGIIRDDKRKVIGGFHITTFRYNNEATPKLIKGIYLENTLNKKSYSYDYYSEFFYDNKQPIYLKLTITRKDKTGFEETLQFDLDKEELENDKEIKNIFLLNLRKKINYMNSAIIN